MPIQLKEVKPKFAVIRRIYISENSSNQIPLMNGYFAMSKSGMLSYEQSETFTSRKMWELLY